MENAKRLEAELASGVFHRYAKWSELILNLAICLGILFAVAFIPEWQIRRKSAKAEPPNGGTT